MLDENDKNVRIPLPGEVGKHIDHKLRTIIVNAEEGVKALYCVNEKRIVAYIFAKNKGWDLVKGKAWVKERVKLYKSFNETHVDQEAEFINLICVKQDDSSDVFKPKSPAFIMEDKIADFTMGMDDVCEAAEVVDMEKVQKYHKFVVVEAAEFVRTDFKVIDIDGEAGIRAVVGKLEGKEATTLQSYLFATDKWEVDEAKDWLKEHDVEYLSVEEGDKPEEEEEKSMGGEGGDMSKEVEGQFNEMEFVKLDKDKHLVYGVFLVPDKADHDGDVISAEDIEKVSHGFIKDYRTIDEMHEDIISASIVESAIAWMDDMDYHGKKLKKGTWFGAIKIEDMEVWDKVVAGVYKGFSVRIAGIREPIKE